MEGNRRIKQNVLEGFLMKFNRVNYSKLKLDTNSSVSKTYITLVQNNKPQEVVITEDECKRSVRTLSRLNKKKKGKKTTEK